MRLPGDLPDNTLSRGATIPVPSSNRILRVYRDAGGWLQSEIEPNVFTDEHKLEFVIGSGANRLSLVVERDHHLFQAPLSYYSKPGKWDLSPGYEYADLGFSRPIAEQCILCHSGRAPSLYQTATENTSIPHSANWQSDARIAMAPADCTSVSRSGLDR